MCEITPVILLAPVDMYLVGAADTPATFVFVDVTVVGKDPVTAGYIGPVDELADVLDAGNAALDVEVGKESNATSMILGVSLVI